MADKKPIIPDGTVYQQRIEICSRCEHLLKVTFQCKKCGCFMKMKAFIFDSKCPEDKWIK